MSSTLEATQSQTDLLARFRRDLPYYSAACLQIRTKSAEVRYLELNQAQRIVHEKISRQRQQTGRVRAAILKARQEGVSTYTAARFKRRMNLWPNTQGLVIADEDDRSGVLYEIYDRFQEHMPIELRLGKRTSLKRKRLALENGSSLEVETAGDVQALQDYARRTKRPVARGNLVTVNKGIVFRPAERGYLQIFELPAKNGHYVIGADTAEGKLAAAVDTGISDPDAERGGRDFNSASVMLVEEEIEYKDDAGHRKTKREKRNRQVATLHGRMDPDVFAEQLARLGYFFSCAGGVQKRSTRRPALIAVERNHASGQSTLRELRRTHKYPRLFWHRRINVREEKPSDVLGWVTNSDTRMAMLDELAAAVRQGRIGIASADTVREMTTFVRGQDGKPEAQEGTHDDRVLDLGITWQLAQHHHSDQPPSAPPPKVEVADTPTGLP